MKKKKKMCVICLQDDGIMDHDTDGDGAINLSTSQRPSASTTPNGDTPTYGQEQQDNDQVRVMGQMFLLFVFRARVCVTMCLRFQESKEYNFKYDKCIKYA